MAEDRMTSDQQLGTSLRLHARTAADLMTKGPVSIYEGSGLASAARSLTKRDFGAMPVVDQTGHIVGVVSRTDIVRALRADSDGEALRDFTSLQGVEVREVMTPEVYAVAPETPALALIEEMVSRQVHRLFVVDDVGLLVGVVSAFDVLRALAPGT